MVVGEADVARAHAINDRWPASAEAAIVRIAILASIVIDGVAVDLDSVGGSQIGVPGKDRAFPTSVDDVVADANMAAAPDIDTDALGILDFEADDINVLSADSNAISVRWLRSRVENHFFTRIGLERDPCARSAFGGDPVHHGWGVCSTSEQDRVPCCDLGCGMCKCRKWAVQRSRVGVVTGRGNVVGIGGGGAAWDEHPHTSGCHQRGKTNS